MHNFGQCCENLRRLQAKKSKTELFFICRVFIEWPQHCQYLMIDLPNINIFGTAQLNKLILKMSCRIDLRGLFVCAQLIFEILQFSPRKEQLSPL